MDFFWWFQNNQLTLILKLCSKLRHEAGVTRYKRAEKMITSVPGQLIKINATILPQKNWATMAEQGI